MDVETAIRNGNANELRRLLQEDPSRANELIRWGDDKKLFTHPLHYISDVVFTGRLPKHAEILLVDALIEAGADLNFQREREDGRKSDTPLIGAASLGAEDIGIRLLDAGAKPEPVGLFGETALHWAAMLGEDRLAARLVEGQGAYLLNLKDERYKSPPLGWAVHGWSNPPAGNHGRHREVITLLVSAGAIVERGLLDSDCVRSNPAMLAALRPAKP